jgi:nucleoside-diphosphate-sugar epimerase
MAAGRKGAAGVGAASEALVVCVVGGSGFLGAHVCRLLGETRAIGRHAVREVRVLDLVAPRGSQFDLWMKVAKEQWPAAQPTLTYMRGDITQLADCLAALDGVDVVVHTASLVDFGNKAPELIYKVNVVGTHTVVRACQERKVRALVYTSSLDAITFWGDSVDLPSSAPYPPTVDDNAGGHYGFSKMLAEKHVLAADGAALSTVGLRMRGIYGEGDPYYIVSVIKATASGLLLFKIGDGRAPNDHTYVGNGAWAHICAAQRLLEPGNTVHGRAFNISYEEPCSLYEKVAPFLEVFKLKVPSAAVPAALMWHLAHLLELLFSLIPRVVRPTLLLTREAVEAITRHKTFRDPRARKELGFEPLYSPDECTVRTIRWLREEWAERPGQETAAGAAWDVRAMTRLLLGALLTRYLVLVFLRV